MVTPRSRELSQRACNLRRLACLFACSVIVPGAARADSEGVGDTTASAPARTGQQTLDAAIAEVVALRNQGKPEAALAAAERAYREQPHVQLLARIAFAEAALQRWPEAYEHLRAALQDQSDPWIERERANLTRELNERWSHEVALVQISVTPKDPNTRVVLNGVEHAPSSRGDTIAIGPGPLHIEVIVPGYRTAARTLDAVAGPNPTVVTVELSPLQLATRVPPPPPSKPSQVGTRRHASWLIVGAAGAAVAASALIPWTMGNSEVKALASECAEGPCDNSDARERVKTLDTVTSILLIAGSIGAASGIAGYLIDVDETSEPSLVVQCGASGCGVMHRGRF